MTTLHNKFIDARGRTLCIVSSEKEINARNHNVLVACFKFVTFTKNKLILAPMNIAEGFQQCGLGTYIMRYAIQKFGHFYVPNYECSLATGHKHYLLEPGKAFICACLERGVIDHSFLSPSIPR